MIKTDVLVIGGGVGGLAAAGLWAKSGHTVALIESHFALGGCASFFSRSEGHYDVGATTLTGLNGTKPTIKFLNDLDIKLNYTHCNPGITAKLGDKSVCFYTDMRMLANEFNNKFDLDFDIYNYLLQLKKIEKVLWNSLELIGGKGLFDLKSMSSMINKENIELIKRPSLFYKSLYAFFPKKLQDNKEFIAVVDELLLISTQQKSDTCPAFMGILGLFYPQDTYASKGGMKGFIDAIECSLKKLDVKFFMNNKCQSIEKIAQGYVVKTSSNEFLTKRVIANIAPEIFYQMYGQKSLAKDTGEIWGAITGYFYFICAKPNDRLFHQVHLENSSLFYSLQGPYELECGNYKYLVTVSTHTKTKGFKCRNKDYQNIKQSYKNLILNNFNKYFKEFAVLEVHFDSISTPLSFKRYTHRKNGEVGGLVHKSVYSLTRLMPNIIPEEKIYFVGDYSFPGQGIVSVIQSAYNTLKERE